MFSGGTLWFIFLIGEEAFPGRRVGLGAMFLAASVPTFVSISASINNDNLVTLAYTAGLYGCVRVLRRGRISHRMALALALILWVAALSKLSGLGLFAVVGVALLAGRWYRTLAWGDVIRVGAWGAGIVGLGAGWWYWRNWRLYGDPFALEATRAIWRRDALPGDWGGVLFEARGVWTSFWMTLGQFNIFGPVWFYEYLEYGVAIAIAGVTLASIRRRPWRVGIFALVLVCAWQVLLLILATRQINVSQGRILFPALGALMPLLVLGWYAVLGQALSRLALLPLAVMAIWAPVALLPATFAGLKTVQDLPPGARPILAESESLRLRGYWLETQMVGAAETVEMDIFFEGQHSDNALLFLRVLDPITRDILGEFTGAPGMAPTARLDPADLYAASVKIRLNERVLGCSPCRTEFIVGWFNPKTQQNIPFTVGDEEAVESVLGFGPVWMGQVPGAAPLQPMEPVALGPEIALVGYRLHGVNDGAVAPGDALVVEVRLAYPAPFFQDWTLVLAC
ncbi:MAG: hypothetical protein HC915_04575 [Anaerolineae bacterium]|nr:hypothetical protein [Anaerolineae bacterium]